MADERHIAALGVGMNSLTRRPLRAYKQNGAAIGDGRLHKRAGFARQRQAPLEVDDVDFVTFAKDEGCHLRVPVTGLMPKMHASL